MQESHGDSRDINMQDVDESLLEVLLCSFCKQYTLPPITCCRNRHVICSRCRLVIRRCPTCLTPFIDTPDSALEYVANKSLFPCWKRAYGCPVRLPAQSVMEHKITCQYKTYTACPFGKIRRMDCNWKGEDSVLRNHLHTIHGTVIREVNSKFRIIFPRDGQRKCSYEVICVFDMLFFYVWEVTSSRVRLSVFYIGSENIAHKFKYKFAVCKTSSAMHHSWGAKILELSEWEERFTCGNSVSLPMNVFRVLIRNYRQPFALKIYRLM